MTAEQVAKLLQVKPERLKRMRAAGRGPAFIREGRLIRYRPQAVSDWLRACEQGGDSGRR